jgi:hypothetical protein
VRTRVLGLGVGYVSDKDSRGTGHESPISHEDADAEIEHKPHR